VYCFGIPFVSWCLLKANKKDIQTLQMIEFSRANLDKLVRVEKEKKRRESLSEMAKVGHFLLGYPH
jgi:hypothetical protein